MPCGVSLIRGRRLVLYRRTSVGYLISKDFSFSASHVLMGLPEGHKCARLHGHTYLVRAEIRGELDTVGFVVDFGELDWFRGLIETTLDHRHLNDVLDLNPTSENIANWLATQLHTWLRNRVDSNRFEMARVGLSESPSSWAYSPAHNPSK
jgi:6-pyruvoyltetrahydropterin/6-carboxytetrahydropterin synthase